MAERPRRRTGDRVAWTAPLTIAAPGLTWMSVHGNLCLALRHPLNRGASRDLVERFLLELGGKLVDAGVLTPEELAQAEGEQATEVRRIQGGT